jgi:hypothetical protein
MEKVERGILRHGPVGFIFEMETVHLQAESLRIAASISVTPRGLWVEAKAFRSGLWTVVRDLALEWDCLMGFDNPDPQGALMPHGSI